MHPVSFLKPKFPKFTNVKKPFQKVYKSYNFSNNGQIVEEFERQMKEMFQFDGEIITGANATICLMVALKALNLRKVLVPSFTFPATIQSLEWCGIDYEYVDIDRTTWTIDIEDLEEKILRFKPDGILPVHSFGNPCDVKSIERLSKIHNLKVVYDSASAISSFYTIDGKPTHISNFGDVSVFSFHATKVLPCGEGGAIFVKDKDLGKRIKQICNFDLDEDKIPQGVFGINNKMSEIHGIFALTSLQDLAINQRDRLLLVDKYKVSLDIEFKIQENFKDAMSSWQVLTVVNDSLNAELRDDLIKELEKENIFCRKYYFPVMHRVFPKKNLKLENTNYICDRIIALPFHLWLSEDEIQKVARALTENLETLRS